MKNKMDYQFPQQLFPSFYNCGPPDLVLKHCAGNWGCYDRVRPQGGSGPLSSWTFTPRHQTGGETWLHTEPVPVPLLTPKNSLLWSSKPPDPLDFTEHMQNFYLDHSQDAFGCMSELLGTNFNFDLFQKKKDVKKVKMGIVTSFLDLLKYKICHKAYSSYRVHTYSALMSDVVQDIPPDLLGGLLYEELTEQRDRLLFSEGSTGGALAFVPFSQSGSGSQLGCLLYPANQGLECLNFHQVELQHQRGGFSFVDASSSKRFSFQLKAPVRQISCTSQFNDCCVAVRSDHLCGVWRFSEKNEPRLLQVVNTKEVATCISVSPHVLGEVLVASESGGAKLWTVGRGMQKVREENQNLYFNAKSSWRWCEFSAHPRVMLYADRTGVELTDIRVDPVVSHTLFRISSTSECRSGERLILCRYLGDIHSFHHLVTTQYSAYIVDERFPSVPMLKWDHMMQSPPMFCHVLPGSASFDSSKVLLGSHFAQEIMLFQYSGGRAEACFSRGPPQALLRPRDSLKHLPVQIPHRLDIATNRLSSPAAGLTCIQKKEAGGEECICIMQLTEAGDVFYQILEPEQTDTSQRPAAEEETPPQQAAKTLPTLKGTTISGRKTAEQLQADSQLIVSDTSSDEDVIGPTQVPTAKKFVAETPEREQQTQNMFSDSNSEDSESERKRQKWKQFLLHVSVNDDAKLEDESTLDSSKKDGQVGENKADNTEEPTSVEEAISGSSSLSHKTLVELSDNTLATWKHWLQKLMQKSRKKHPHSHGLLNFTIKTKDVLCPSNDKASESTEEEHVQNLRRDLRACMSKRSLLVQSTVSASLGAPDVVSPIPNVVDTEDWTDHLSQRLTRSWQGEEEWQAWWEDQLGLNREQKVEALRRKRRREKEARRASGRRLELSGSFTSSVGSQSELSDFSELSGWSSAGSQGVWSDSESMASQLGGFLDHGTPRATTPSTMQSEALVQTPATTPTATPTATPQKVKDKQSKQQTRTSPRILALTQTPKLQSTPSSQKTNKRPTKDYLSALYAPQEECSQHDGYFLEEGSTDQPASSPVASSLYQLRSPMSVSQRGFRVGLSQDSSIWSGFSQSLSQSQSSQGRLGLSQSSQPKKKSRMGF